MERWALASPLPCCRLRARQKKRLPAAIPPCSPSFLFLVPFLLVHLAVPDFFVLGNHRSNTAIVPPCRAPNGTRRSHTPAAWLSLRRAPGISSAKNRVASTPRLGAAVCCGINSGLARVFQAFPGPDPVVIVAFLNQPTPKHHLVFDLSRPRAWFLFSSDLRVRL
jgi:hypothetical protein